MDKDACSASFAAWERMLRGRVGRLQYLLLELFEPLYEVDQQSCQLVEGGVLCSKNVACIAVLHF